MIVPAKTRSMFDEYASSDMMNLRLLSSDFATASLAAGAAAEVEAKLHILHRIQKQGYPDKLAAGGKMHNISHLIKAYKSIQKEIDKLLRRHGTGFAVHH